MSANNGLSPMLTVREMSPHELIIGFKDAAVYAYSKRVYVLISVS